MSEMWNQNGPCSGKKAEVWAEAGGKLEGGDEAMVEAEEVQIHLFLLIRREH